MSVNVLIDPDETVNAADGYIAVASLTADPPTAIEDFIPDESGDVDLPAGWIALGSLTDAGPQFSFGKDSKDIPGWPGRDPIRTLITANPSSVKATLQQWSSEAFKLGLSGAIVETAGGGVVVTPEDDSFNDERQFVLYGADGDKNYGFWIPRAKNVANLDFAFTTGDLAALPIEMKVLKPADGAKRVNLFTDDTAFVLDGS